MFEIDIFPGLLVSSGWLSMVEMEDTASHKTKVHRYKIEAEASSQDNLCCYCTKVHLLGKY